MNELLNMIGIDDKSKLKKHPKMKLFLNYIIENNCDVYEHGFYIKADCFQVLLENIHSFDVLLEILKKSADLLSINFNPKEMADFYNLYDPRIIQFSKDALILIDEEYLKYTTIKWTVEKFLKIDKVLYVSKERIILKDNPNKDDEYKYVESYLLNFVALKKAKELNLLKEAIERLIKG